ncbi:MAG: hypothetical protein JWQ21_1284 [Herminiimonas sp.]|nr:hypothetical protein [Herminiimonas sp.]
MALISDIGRELIGLFIDDGSLAVATAAILGAVGAARYAGLVDSTAAAVLLCGGFVLVILENVLRSARVIK